MNVEIILGSKPLDVRKHRRGYDIESCDIEGDLRFIVVKARQVDAAPVTLTYNESITALNCADQHILALVEFDSKKAINVQYVRNYPFREPAPSEYNVNIDLCELHDYCHKPR